MEALDVRTIEWNTFVRSDRDFYRTLFRISPCRSPTGTSVPWWQCGPRRISLRRKVLSQRLSILPEGSLLFSLRCKSRSEGLPVSQIPSRIVEVSDGTEKSPAIKALFAKHFSDFRKATAETVVSGTISWQGFPPAIPFPLGWRFLWFRGSDNLLGSQTWITVIGRPRDQTRWLGGWDLVGYEFHRVFPFKRCLEQLRRLWGCRIKRGVFLSGPFRVYTGRYSENSFLYLAGLRSRDMRKSQLPCSVGGSPTFSLVQETLFWPKEGFKRISGFKFFPLPTFPIVGKSSCLRTNVYFFGLEFKLRLYWIRWKTMSSLTCHLSLVSLPGVSTLRLSFRLIARATCHSSYGCGAYPSRWHVTGPG